MRAAAGTEKAIKDDLYRLTQATNTSTPAETQSWTYDAIGRITFNSRVGNYTYPTVGSARPHAPTTAGGNSYSYDPNGNLTTGAGRTLTWDTNNRLGQATVASTTTNFTYDDDGDRLKKTTGTSTSLYPLGDDDYEITGGVITKYFSMHGVSIAKKVGSGGGAQTYWLHSDRLGSVQAITDSTGALVQRRTYRPYGEKIADSTSHVESKGWINERNDAETGLTYLHARYYDPALGTFISPDAVHPAEAGVGLHRYGYGFGNPINLTDRGGAWICVGYDEGNSSGGVWCWDETKAGPSGGGGGAPGGSGPGGNCYYGYCPGGSDGGNDDGGRRGGGGRRGDDGNNNTGDGNDDQGKDKEKDKDKDKDKEKCKAGDLTCDPKKDEEKKNEEKKDEEKKEPVKRPYVPGYPTCQGFWAQYADNFEMTHRYMAETGFEAAKTVISAAEAFGHAYRPLSLFLTGYGGRVAGNYFLGVAGSAAARSLGVSVGGFYGGLAAGNFAPTLRDMYACNS